MLSRRPGAATTALLFHAVSMFVALAAPPAAANRNLGAGLSGRTGFSCVNCHTSNSAPTVVVTGIPEGTLPKGSNLALTVTVTPVDTAGGSGSCPNRCAGVGIASDGAGTFAAGTGTKLAGSEIVHASPQPYSDGRAVFTLELNALQGGAHRLFVGANDINGNNSTSGDRARAISLDLDVAEGEEEPVDGEGEVPIVDDGEGEPVVVDGDDDPAPADGAFCGAAKSDGSLGGFALLLLLTRLRRRAARAGSSTI